MSDDRTLDGVSLTNLDEPLFAEADAIKRDLVDYLTAGGGSDHPRAAGPAARVSEAADTTVAQDHDIADRRTERI